MWWHKKAATLLKIKIHKILSYNSWIAQLIKKVVNTDKINWGAINLQNAFFVDNGDSSSSSSLNIKCLLQPITTFREIFFMRMATLEDHSNSLTCRRSSSLKYNRNHHAFGISRHKKQYWTCCTCLLDSSISMSRKSRLRNQGLVDIWIVKTTT